MKRILGYLLFVALTQGTFLSASEAPPRDGIKKWWGCTLPAGKKGTEEARKTAQLFSTAASDKAFPPYINKSEEGHYHADIANGIPFEATYMIRGTQGVIFDLVLNDIDPATHEKTAHPLVIKTYVSGSEAAQREADALSFFNGSGYTPDLYGAFSDGFQTILAMEKFEQQDLLMVIKEGRGLSAQRWEMVAAVAAVHARGYAHLDIKLENFFVTKNGKVKLGDFGFACTANMPYKGSGTRGGWPPEILLPKNTVDGLYVGNRNRLDTYALGIALLAHKYRDIYAYPQHYLLHNKYKLKEAEGELDAPGRQFAIQRLYALDVRKGILRGAGKKVFAELGAEDKLIYRALAPEPEEAISLADLVEGYRQLPIPAH